MEEPVGQTWNGEAPISNGGPGTIGSPTGDGPEYKPLCKNLFLCNTNAANSFVCYSNLKYIWTDYILLKSGGTFQH